MVIPVPGSATQTVTIQPTYRLDKGSGRFGGGTLVGCAGNCWQAPAVSLDQGTTWTGQAETRVHPGERRLLPTPTLPPRWSTGR